MLKRVIQWSCILAAATVVLAQTPPAAPGDKAALALAATSSFNSGNYASALPMYQKLADLSKDQPDQLGPIQEKIRVCQTNLTSGGPTTAPTSQPANLTAIGADRVPHPAPKDGEVLTMGIKELGNFDYDADHGGNIPADIKALSGHTIQLNGFMIPMDQAANITQFALVPSLFACCFGQPPQIQHTIVVNCPKGKAVNYFPDEINVTGTLHVEEKKDEGYIVSIFDITCDSVKPVGK